MRRLFFVAGIVGLGCGSGDSLGNSSAESSDAGADAFGDRAIDHTEGADHPEGATGSEAGDAEASALDASDAVAEGGADAPTCKAWTYWNEGLSGGAVDWVQFDPRTAGLAFAAAGLQLNR